MSIDRQYLHDVTSTENNDIEEIQSASRIPPFETLGWTGLKRNTGIISEEYLPALKGRKAVAIYREMENDPTIAAMLFTITHLLKGLEWRIEAMETTPEHIEAQEFIEECMQDMEHSWPTLIDNILTCLTYGWSFFEITYKQRVGPFEDKPSRKSTHSDNKIGWRKIAIRAQETLHRWVFSEEGDVLGMVQLAPPHFKQTFIPMTKSLLFRYRPVKNNPEGTSLLRPAYTSYMFKKRLQEIEAIGIERDLAGMPVGRVPSHYMNAAKGTKENKLFEQFKKMVSNIRRDQHDGLVLPMEYDRDTKQPLFEFELMSSGGARQFDMQPVIDRYDNAILGTVLADFIKLGQTETGSYAMHVSKTGIFKQGLNSLALAIAEVFNRHAIPQLLKLNGIQIDPMPRLVPQNVENPNLAELVQFMSGLSALGVEWFPDLDLEEFIRNAAGLPELPEDIKEMKKQQAEQAHMMKDMEQESQMAQLQQPGLQNEQQQMQMQQQGEQYEQQQAQEQQALQEQEEQTAAEQALADWEAFKAGELGEEYSPPQSSSDSKPSQSKKKAEK